LFVSSWFLVVTACEGTKKSANDKRKALFSLVIRHFFRTFAHEEDSPAHHPPQGRRKAHPTHLVLAAPAAHIVSARRAYQQRALLILAAPAAR